MKPFNPEIQDNTFLRKRQPASSEVKASLRLFPTLYGFLLLAILISMLVGSLNYDNNPGFLLTFLLSGMVFFSIIMTSENILGIEVKALPVKPVFAGDEAVFQFIVTPKKKRRRAINFSINNKIFTTIDLVKNIEETQMIRLRCDKRGIFNPGPLRISTQFPFGIFSAEIELDTQTSCLVYPFPISSGGGETHEIPDDAENGQTEKSGFGDISELRSYVPGDPLHRIAWKASLRGHGLLTKEFIDHVNPSIILDYSSIKQGDIEFRLSRLCHMVLEADKKGTPYGLKLPNQTIKPGQGPLHKRDCLNALALFEVMDLDSISNGV